MATKQESESLDRLEADVRRKIEDAAEDRKRFEAGWHISLAFAAGKQWLVWSERDRRAILPPELNPQELYTADRVTEYRMTALGELGMDRDRPELLLVRDDRFGEEYQEAANLAVGHAWEHEAQADIALADKDRLVVDLGTAAIRCRFDPTRGRVVRNEQPFADDRPLFGDEATRAVAEAAMQGRTLEYRDIREGRINLDVLGPWNLLPPPGVPHERDFPWEIIVRPVPLADLKRVYGARAAKLVEDTDIVSLLGLSSNVETPLGRGLEDGAGTQRRLRGFAWLYTYFERPCPDYPRGRTVALATSNKTLLRVDDRLPYVGPSGEYRSGISYFHWWRQTGRFWSRGLVEAMQDGQRRYNKRATQNGKIIDRGMPKVFLQVDSIKKVPRGFPMEAVELQDMAKEPRFFSGIGPGEWMWEDLRQVESDISHATGFYGPSRGENPENVTTYSQLALIAENDQVKRQPIIREHKDSERFIVEDILYDVVRYWPPDKKIRVVGDDESEFRLVAFDATKIPSPEQEPDFYTVRVAKGSAKPRSQAAQLQLVQDIWRASIDAQQPLPLSWLYESLRAGQPRDLPEQPGSNQEYVAEIENHYMLQGESRPVFYYDDPETHVMVHRLAQDQARLSGDEQTWNVIEQHILAHQQAAIANQEMVAQQGGGTLPSDPEAPPQQIPEPETPPGGVQ